MVSNVTVFICVSCNAEHAAGTGSGLFEAVKAALEEHPGHTITVEPVECLAVCKRPATVALVAPGKWTYVVGDLDAAANVGDVVTSALNYAATANGIIPWKQRPQAFRKGVIARIPPIGTPA